MESMVMNAPNNNVTSVNANGEDLATLEAEISELHRENARVEGQMLRLKSDINAIESHLTHGERVRFTTLLPNRTGWLKQKISCNLNFHYTTSTTLLRISFNLTIEQVTAGLVESISALY